MAGPIVPDATTTALPLPEGVPPLPADATPEEKDAWWFKHVYQGDKMPQLTLRAVVMGGILGMLMSAANLYTTLAIGWSFGVAITACVMSYVIWSGFRLLSGGAISKMSILENNCMQSTAAAAGSSTGATIGVMFGAMLLLAKPGEGQEAKDVISWHVSPWWSVGIFTMATAALGVFLAVPMKRQMINHEQLRFPSGVAAAETLRSLYSESVDALHKAYTLIVGLVLGLIIGVLNTGEGAITKLDEFFAKVPIRLPDSIPESGTFFTIANKAPNGFALDPSFLLIAAGIITRMRVCLSMFLGSCLLYFVVAPALVNADQMNGPATGWFKQGEAWVYDARTRDAAIHQNIELNIKDPTLNRQAVEADPSKGVDNPKKPTQFTGTTLKFTTWSLWGGTAVMVFASLTAIALSWRTVARAFSGLFGEKKIRDDALAEIEVPTKWMVIGMIPISIALLCVQVIAFDISWWAGLISIALAFFLSLVACRATGETDTTPIGAMGKVMQLTFAVLHPGKIIPNLAAAGVAANSASSSADLLTDLKSGYLLGANPRKQFLAQFVGVFFGTIAIVPVWFLMIPNQAALEKYAAPATRQWEAVARVLTQGISTLPMSARYAVLIGAFVGIVLPLLERSLPLRYKKFVPSAMGLGLSWVVPFGNAAAFFIGALVGWIWELVHRKSSEKYSIALASGLIAGESLMKAIVAMLATAIGLLK